MERSMKREVIRVEPLSTYLERWKAPTSVVTRTGNTIHVSGLPRFDPETGKIVDAPIKRQTEFVLEQMKLCLEMAGSSLEDVLKCNVYCTSVDKLRGRQCDLCPVLSQRLACPDLRLRSCLAGAFRHRTRRRRRRLVGL
jgi:enamine deaminase RidA (YjgF/YER057c/UK114 family)